MTTEIVAVQKGSEIHFSLEPLRELREAIENNRHTKEPIKLISREIFKFMEDADIWRHYNFSKKPTLMTLTKENYETAYDFGLFDPNGVIV